MNRSLTPILSKPTFLPIVLYYTYLVPLTVPYGLLAVVRKRSMAQYRRSNAWNNAGTFDNPDLLWYAKGVGAMMARQLSDPLSWWFFAAIHGEYVSVTGFPGWGDLPAPPQVPTSPVPTSGVQTQFWN